MKMKSYSYEIKRFTRIKSHNYEKKSKFCMNEVIQVRERSRHFTRIKLYSYKKKVKIYENKLANYEENK